MFTLTTKTNRLPLLIFLQVMYELVNGMYSILPGIKTGPYPDLTVIIFRYPEDEDNTINQQLINAIHTDGRVFLSSTVIKGKVWLRCAVVSHRTHLDEIELALQMIRENIERIIS
ncbi:MAG: hypothetical protein M3342_06335 [Bacteroidota bacterium]|nr:hypothetical protein [Bacteroidota bacterium]